VKAALLGAAAAGVTAAAASVVISDQAPYPYSLHRLLDIPLPLLTARRLDSLLEPRAGQQVLEIGPGTGLQSLHVAPQLGAGGQLAVVDVQLEMLEHVMAGLHLARRTGVPLAYYALFRPCRAERPGAAS
jgi:hypothetical protein